MSQVELKTMPAKIREKGDVWVIEWPRNLTHIHTYGLLTPYFKGLAQGKLLGTKCTNPKCPIYKGNGDTWIPPRADCPDCHMPMEWVELKNPVVGNLYTFTWVERGGTGLEIETPYWQIDVQISGVTTIVKGYLVDREKNIKIGQKVQAVFNTKNPTHTALDLSWKLV